MRKDEMPLKIWVRAVGGGSDFPSGKPYTIFFGEDRDVYGRNVYIRIDIAQRLSDALEQCVDAKMLGKDRRDVAVMALSAFKAATK